MSSRAVMFVNGTAPFVFSGTLVNGPSGTIKYVTPQVLYTSVNNPPANRISGLEQYIYDKALQKYSHPNFSDQTRFYKLGILVLPQNGRQARITLSACQGYQVSPGNKASTWFFSTKLLL